MPTTLTDAQKQAILADPAKLKQLAEDMKAEATRLEAYALNPKAYNTLTAAEAKCWIFACFIGANIATK